MGLSSLFKPAWQGHNKKKALKAVKKENSQIKLAEIAKNAPLFDVCEAAVNKLTDQNMLAGIVIENKGYSNIAVKAVEKLTDQTLLADVAKRCINTPVLMGAIKNLNDQKTLADFAQHSNNIFPCVAAINKLSDQTLVKKIFTSIVKKPYIIGGRDTRMEVVRIITNQVMLAELAQNDTDWSVRAAAVEKLEDQELIIKFARYDVIREVRIAAAGKMTDRHLAQEILNGIEKNKRTEYRQPVSYKVINPPISYDEFVNTVKKFINASEYDKVQTAIKGLTNQNILSEIVNGNENEWCIDRGSDNYGPYNIIDLRETAQNRLKELEKTGIQPEAIEKEGSIDVIEKVHTAIDITERPNNDLFFMIQSFKDSQKVMIKGLIDGVLIKTPESTKMVQQFPRDAECLYQLQNLDLLPGLKTLDLITGDTQLPFNTTYYGSIVLHHGFPTVCLKCRKPVTKFELLMAPVYNKRMRKVVIHADNAQEIFDVLENIRHFIAIPCCNEHSLANRFFFGVGLFPFFTDDKDIANTCEAHSIKRNYPVSPVRVVKGEIMID